MKKTISVFNHYLVPILFIIIMASSLNGCHLLHHGHHGHHGHHFNQDSHHSRHLQGNLKAKHQARHHRY